jgi:hypothetical protein
MSKDAYYFPHDSNARHDPKIIAMTSVYGMEGYAWYWIIVEMLREQESYRYSFKSKYAINSMAKEMNTSADNAKAYIDDCVNEFELMEISDEMLSCPSLDKRMVRLDKRRAQARSAANARWKKNTDDVDELSFEEETKKEVDPKKVKTMEVLTNSIYFAFFSSELSESENFGDMKNIDVFLAKERDIAVDWMRSKGRKFKDYRAFFRNWIRRKLVELNNPKEEIKSNNPQLNNPYK